MVAGTTSTVFINEIHYDNTGVDAGEFIEIANTGGIDLTGWSIVLYNGATGAVYDTDALSGSATTTVISYPSNGIQNGAPDGIALVNASGTVVQFLSYEGTFTGVGGAANGLLSTDIGISQASTEALGSSLHLTGSGTTYGDFVWSATSTNSAGSTNAGQTFGSAPPPPPPPPAADVFLSEIHYDNVGGDTGEFVEVSGTAGTSLDGFKIIFYNGNGGAAYATLNLSGTIDDEGAGMGAVSFAQTGIQNGAPDGFALVDPSGVVLEFLSYEGSFTAVGGDANGLTSTDIGVSEPDTTPVGQSLQKIDGVWTGPATASAGTLNDAAPPPPPPPPPPAPATTAIYDIQGSGLTSALVGQSVNTSGIVTAVDSNGFYLQDPTGDGNAATSDGIFVFTSSRPTVTAGDALTVSGTVSEFTPGGLATGNLSTTQISRATFTIVNNNNALPAAVVIDGSAIDGQDIAAGIAYFEALEGMLVTVADPLVVAGTNGFGEIFTVAGNGAHATGLSTRGTINITGPGAPGVLAETDIFGDADYNPERIQIQLDTGVTPGATLPTVAAGAKLNDVTGVVSYNFGNYEVVATQPVTVDQASALTPEITSIVGTDEQLTVASYNVLNLDPGDGAAKFAALAADIVFNLQAPDIIALQEVQDNSGATNDGTVSASITLQMLVDAIDAAGGPSYSWIDNPFITNNDSGGQPGGNIRTAFLYLDERVDLVSGSVRTIEGEDQATDPNNPFFDARLPLVATFTFNDADITLVNNHFSSKGGSTPLLGAVQPSLNGSADERLDQAQAVATFVTAEQELVDGVIVLGDLNEFEFEDSLQPLYDTGLENLTNTLPEDERYTFNFQGNSQSLDHIFTTGGLADAASFDAVHVNTEFAIVDQASDHDPLVAGFTLATQETRTNGSRGDDDLTGGDTTEDVIAGNRGNDTINGGGRDDFLLGNGGEDKLYGGTGEDALFGGQGNDMLFGEAGDDRLSGDRGDDLLSGGAGGDTFVFGKKFGSDVITDFTAADDTIEFSAKVFASFAQVQAASSQQGSDVLINAGGGNMVLIENVLLSDLTASDFLFV